jgi:FixJ family two-component response regulator
MVGRRVVSVIDDDESIRLAIESLVRSVGLRTAAFASGDEFLRSRQLRHTGCLILDLQMPGMGGLELQSRLARQGGCIPIIIFTAHGDDDTRAEALGAGAGRVPVEAGGWRRADQRGSGGPERPMMGKTSHSREEDDR